MVEPNNTGRVSDNFNNHVKGAEQIIYNFGYIGKYLADSLKNPLLVPIFPRSEKECKTYTHVQDKDALKTEMAAIKRIDSHLISMIDDANLVLTKMSYTFQENLIMTRFSPSATFTNRFTFLRPERVKLCEPDL